MHAIINNTTASIIRTSAPAAPPLNDMDTCTYDVVGDHNYDMIKGKHSKTMTPPTNTGEGDISLSKCVAYDPVNVLPDPNRERGEDDYAVIQSTSHV